ncbi:hypothetical protein N7492_001505 [Penicillium capsulatum]|uniref:Protein kinase domain-containing protein n=1 Tax=Penicillium capsulatum TaxID=69766 RepID=A0A9W9ITS9_9EURO|nr:hypothetical protein N7492_001505 [Penicillium capsulatum]KAJ6129442.1 hypothetical protein N7512_002222 [Penicillium capsulatum]
MNVLELSNYTEQRPRNFFQLLIDIHEAGIIHLDLYPRNMMVQGDSGQMLLIDYELAQIFGPEHPWQPDWSARGRRLMDFFVEALGRDYKLGKYQETW